MRVNASGVNVGDITINSSTISDGGDFTIDSGGDITLDADGGDVFLKDGGTEYARLTQVSSGLRIQTVANDADIVFRGNDNGGDVDALTLDMSAAGAATFNSLVNANKLQVGGTDVITNARALSNITSIDATTAAAIGAGGVGGGGTVDFTASGSLSNGDLVKLNSNGTVSVVAGGGAGSEANFSSTNCTDNAVTFDSNLNKVVVAYKDGLNNNYGYAVVGTISGSSISFGTPVVFESASSNNIELTFDSNSNKVVIVYRDGGNNNYATAIVGTVSGTSISFGSHAVWETGLAFDIAITFDSNSNKVVIAYRDYSNSQHGAAIVGTVSGTSITFGSKVVFESAQSEEISLAFDSNSNKVVIAYKDDANSAYGTAIVGTVSGTSISFGTAVVFSSSATKLTSTVFDSNSNKIVIAYEDNDDGQRGEAVVGTVSGTSISFGTPVAFQGSVGKIGNYISAVFDSGSNQVVIAYEDDTASPKELSVIVCTVSGTTLNFIPKVDLDTEGYEQVGITFDSNSNRAVVVWSKQSNNYGTAATFKTTDIFKWIGFASADVADGNTATINVVSSVNEGQSSLSVGSKYYLTDGGTLTTTSVSGREVGFATASTKLLITQGSVS